MKSKNLCKKKQAQSGSIFRRHKFAGLEVVFYTNIGTWPLDLPSPLFHIINAVNILDKYFQQIFELVILQLYAKSKIAYDNYTKIRVCKHMGGNNDESCCSGTI